VQENQSLSVSAGTVRGLHFQSPPRAQGKLVRVVAGEIIDVAVDIRRGSPGRGKVVAERLSADNGHQLWVPPGFAHGFVTLVPNTVVVYKVTDYYSPEHDKGLAWDDPVLGIDWGIDPSAAVLSPKDRTHPRLADLPDYFFYD
jgi:dTDP-4-dehydrorhamnose 3,5-epimerase